MIFVHFCRSKYKKMIEKFHDLRYNNGTKEEYIHLFL